MKKRIAILMGGLFLLLSMTGCADSRAQAAPAPTEAPAPVVTAVTQVITETPVPAAEALQELLLQEGEDRIQGECVSVAEELPYAADLDGDGTTETLDLAVYTRPEDDYPRWALVLTQDGAEKRCETWVPCDTWYDLFVGDLDADGKYEIFFHGDTASDDYLIYGFFSDLTPIPFAPDERLYRYGKMDGDLVFDARVDGFEEGHLVVSGSVNMLGTHDGLRTYGIDENGVMVPLTTVWTFEEDDDRHLTVTKELTAYAARVRRDPGEPFTLEPGDKVWPLASDGYSRLWFKMGGGKTGVLLLTPDEENMWLIDGVPEAEFFENLPYAG